MRLAYKGKIQLEGSSQELHNIRSLVLSSWNSITLKQSTLLFLSYFASWEAHLVR